MRLTIAIALLTALLVPAAAAADGLPVGVEDIGDTGIARADGSYRYTAIKVGPDTLVQRIEQDGGAISDSIRLDGAYTIPAVALDASPGGLSTDGGTLILIRPRTSFPRETTEFVRFDTDDLRSPHPFRLDGDFSFDALSPDGRTMYLINYTSPRDPTEYDVRAFDLASGKLEPGRIVDPEEAGEEMYGYALSRETSPDGQWAYTLYWGNEYPFIHALDTEHGIAACIDLEQLEGFDNMYALGLDLTAGGTGLVVTRMGKPVLAVDSETHGVAEVPTDEVGEAAADGATATGGDGGDSGGGLGAAAIGLGVALCAVAGALATRRRRRALA